MDAGYVIARAAIEDCRKRGIQVAVTVTDRNGTILIVMRDSITASIAVPISQQKAFTAVNFNVATSQLAQRASSPLSNIDGLLMAAGGLPINVAGQLVGGIGVSGAPSGKTDEDCAQAGIDSTKDELELAM